MWIQADARPFTISRIQNPANTSKGGNYEGGSCRECDAAFESTKPSKVSCSSASFLVAYGQQSQAYQVQ